MSYRSLRQCANDLERSGRLIRIRSEVDPYLEMAEIQRRVYAEQGPALLFEKVKNSPFQAISNLYGTKERTRYIFRDTLADAMNLIAIKANPEKALKNPFKYWKLPFTALKALPKKKRRSGPVFYGKTTVEQLPQIVSWPMDGGAFITLPQVFTMPLGSNQIMQSNLGMYRIQLSGNDYQLNEEVGMHYQIHRGIGIHHQQYLKSEDEFKCSIFVGGPPANAFSAIMPLPEGLSELAFAGLLNGKRFPYTKRDGYYYATEADFVLTGVIQKQGLKPEGPFGDHLGYYSLTHDFPVMKVENIYHRKHPLWHFTAVGRPPQEDTSFGFLIHELVQDISKQEFPGVREIHAVDEAGVHPLLLAIGSERYMPFRERDKAPEEILIQANRILGSGQTSLAKFLLIVDGSDDDQLTTYDAERFFSHLLQRVDWKRDLHFHTKTSIDTLDYSGSGWNAGSKVVIAASGRIKRNLASRLPDDFALPDGFGNPQFVLPGILAITGPKFNEKNKDKILSLLSASLEGQKLEEIPLFVVVDDSDFVSLNWNNFVWVTFTRTNPASDIHGVSTFVKDKHWGSNGPIILDARVKPHHAPELIPDKKTVMKVDKLFRKGGDLYNYMKK